MRTLPDYLRAGLVLVSVGLNPSIRSVRAGFYFATPQNRFWRALNASPLVDAPVTPGVEGVEHLFRRCGVGFTDVVKRPSRGGAGLRAADYREWAPLLREKLLRCSPLAAWFHGKQAYRAYLRYAEDRAPEPEIPWGEQAQRIGRARVFVTPNPSPANAAYSLDDLVAWYRALARAARRLGPRAAPDPSGHRSG
ncbi:MAG: mismatch-specific DNA-glycosylase [Gammaproteobacteria bacterium]|nr:mismatch-specific DNA-glycosylase [Gammaproteobacteria bacterium]